MTPSEIFQKFTDRMFQLSLLQRSSRKLISDEIDRLLSLKDFSSLEAFHYYLPSDGALRVLKTRQADRDQALADCRHHKRKQYQWLLAEAYEAFEDFLEESYAAAAMRKPGVWWMSDFGNVVPGDVDERDFQWLLGQARKKKDRPFSILERFRACSERFSRLEEQNATGANYRIAFVLIEKLRHVIVHNHGYIDDLDQVVTRALPQTGKGAKFKESMRDIFTSYLESHDGRDIICLLEVGVAENDPLHRLGGYTDSLGHLFKLLVSFAALVSETVEMLESKHAQP